MSNRTENHSPRDGRSSTGGGGTRFHGRCARRANGALAAGTNQTARVTLILCRIPDETTMLGLQDKAGFTGCRVTAQGGPAFVVALL